MNQVPALLEATTCESLLINRHELVAGARRVGEGGKSDVEETDPKHVTILPY